MTCDDQFVTDGEQVPTHAQQLAIQNAPQPISSDSAQSGPQPKQKLRSMRQRNSSRENGRKSHGPASQSGKRRCAKNSIRDGIFSRQVVVEPLGEKPEEFDSMKASYFTCLQPSGDLEEQFARDVVEYSWRRQRVRTAAEQARRDRLETLQLQQQLRRADETGKLTSRFIIQFENYVAYSKANQFLLPSELEEVLERLMLIPEGIDFFLRLLESIKSHLIADGLLISKEAALLRVIRGSAHGTDIAQWIDGLTLGSESPEFAMQMQQQESENGPGENIDRASSQRDHGAGHDDRKPIFSCSDESLVNAGIAALIDSVAEALTARKEILQKLEQVEMRKQMLLIALDPSDSERFARAETQMERRMYRALAAFSAIRAQSPPLSLPEHETVS